MTARPPQTQTGYILPRVLDTACGMKIVGEQRAKIVGLARGVVLEPGIGGGLNLPFYQPSAISKLIGIDPSIELGNKASAVSGPDPSCAPPPSRRSRR